MWFACGARHRQVGGHPLLSPGASVPQPHAFPNTSLDSRRKLRETKSSVACGRHPPFIPPLRTRRSLRSTAPVTDYGRARLHASSDPPRHVARSPPTLGGGSIRCTLPFHLSQAFSDELELRLQCRSLVFKRLFNLPGIGLWVGARPRAKGPRTPRSRVVRPRPSAASASPRAAAAKSTPSESRKETASWPCKPGRAETHAITGPAAGHGAHPCRSRSISPWHD